jgi:hypothetical protein
LDISHLQYPTGNSRFLVLIGIQIPIHGERDANKQELIGMSTFSKLAGVALLSVAITGSMVFAGDEDSKSACKERCAKACKTACVKSKASCGNKEACKVKRDASKKKFGSDKAKGTHGEFMSKADTDKDGKLSMKEFKTSQMKRNKSQFKMMDTDGDGFLTKADRKGKGKKGKSEKKKKGKKKKEA